MYAYVYVAIHFMLLHIATPVALYYLKQKCTDVQNVSVAIAMDQ